MQIIWSTKQQMNSKETKYTGAISKVYVYFKREGFWEIRTPFSRFKAGWTRPYWKGTSQICLHRSLLKAIFFLNIHICSWKMNWQRQLSCHLCRLPVLILDNRPAKRTKLDRSTFFFLGNVDFIVLDICSKPEKLLRKAKITWGW